MSIEATLSGLFRLLLPAAALAAAVFGVFAVLDRMALNERAAELRALSERSAALDLGAIAPGSALACLDAGVGETAQTACEAAVFASPQSTAAAVAYIGARLKLLADAQPFIKDSLSLTGAMAAARRAIELDRYGIAAHVLATRDGCTPERCAAFGFVADASALKANLKAQVYDQYVSRHADAWNAPDVAPPAPPAMSQTPPAAAEAKAAVPEPPGHPVAGKYDFPSAASIPPVSIMSAEPPLPKGADLAAPDGQGDQKAAQTAPPPVPPKRPQAQRDQAPPAPAR